MTNNFSLVNPYISGESAYLFKKVNADNAFDAMGKIWGSLSQYLTSNMPRLFVTIKDDKNDLYHFIVSEKVKDNKTVETSFKEMEGDEKKNEEHMQLLKIAKKKCAQVGGRKRYDNDDIDDIDDSSSSSSDNDDIDNLIEDAALFRIRNTLHPITYWWYNPLIYTNTFGRSVFVPTFRIPLAPYIEINTGCYHNPCY